MIELGLASTMHAFWPCDQAVAHPLAGLPTLASVVLGPIQFDRPTALWLLLPVLALTVWIGRANLSGLATSTRRVALIVRCLLLTALIAAVAEPSWRRTSKRMVVTGILDVSKSVPPGRQDEAIRWVERNIASNRGEHDGHRDDQFSAMTAAVDPFVQSLPNPTNFTIERGTLGRLEGTDLASAVRLALSLRPADAGYGMLLISDGNETAGNLLQAAAEAKAKGVPIDVMPLRYRNDNEVIVDDVIVPSVARMGEIVNVRVRITTSRPVQGVLSLLVNGQPYDLDPDSDALGTTVRVDPGDPPLIVPVRVARAGPQQFRAVFEPTARGPGQGAPDTIAENNQASAVTFVSSEGRVLILTADTGEAEVVERVLASARIAATVTTPAEGPQTLLELGSFDCVVMLNTPSHMFSQDRIDALVSYVRDLGGGLVMVGGPEGFGAGGWIGSTFEEILPIRLDPPQKRELPAGALVLVNHSIEMPNGRFYGKQVATAAIDALTRLDHFGIIEYAPGLADEASWVHPLSLLGDKSAAKNAINNLVFGDMQSFDASLEKALAGLTAVNAGNRLVILTSDGDPTVSTSVLQKFRRAGVPIAAIAVSAHGPQDTANMQRIAQATGGNFYNVVNPANFASLPAIIFREAETVRRPLIWEGDPFPPTIVSPMHETMAGLRGGLAPIRGYIVAADKEDPRAVVTVRGQEGDPVAAAWSVGLGRVGVFTSDASASRWTALWSSWPALGTFWESQVRWAMRPAGSPNLRMFMQREGDRTRAVIELADRAGRRINLATIDARLSRPDGEGSPAVFQQVGPGRYEAWLDTADPGSYMLGARFAAPDPDNPQATLSGSLQGSVVRPFADEFRALQDNTPLLRQVADLTGGRVLDLQTDQPDQPASTLWRRAGVTFPVSRQPIWLYVALASAALLLLDVAIRRVRIDVRGVVMGLVGSSKRAPSAAGAPMQALRSARDKARGQFAQRARSTEHASAGASVLPAGELRHSAGAKFDVGDAEVRRRTSSGDLGAVSPNSTAGPAPASPAKPAQAQRGQDEGDAGMSRLLQAKKRAQQNLDDRDRDRPQRDRGDM